MRLAQKSIRPGSNGRGSLSEPITDSRRVPRYITTAVSVIGALTGTDRRRSTDNLPSKIRRAVESKEGCERAILDAIRTVQEFGIREAGALRLLGRVAATEDILPAVRNAAQEALKTKRGG